MQILFNIEKIYMLFSAIYASITQDPEMSVLGNSDQSPMNI